MDTSTLAQRERHALADLLAQVGPDAPTLIDWTTGDLAAHLWVREHDPIALVGISGGALAGVAEARMRRATRRLGYPRLVEEVRSGPPRLSWARPIDAAANTLEYLVHHEDVRRAGAHAVAGRAMAEADNEEIMSRLGRMVTPLLGRRGVRTVLVDEATGRSLSAGRGEMVTVTGLPTELALYAFGRERVAYVEVLGPGEQGLGSGAHDS